MKFVSTRDTSNSEISFAQAILNCMPADGGLYVPSTPSDLRRWILYADEKTSFANLAGTLTSALIHTEFSPIICEAMATRAFTFEPRLVQLSDRFFVLELHHTPTGSHKDFGIAWLVNCVETLLTMKESAGIFLDTSGGELGASLARALRGKKRIKAIVLYPRGRIRGIRKDDLLENGGNLYPVEIDGTEEDCHAIVRAIFSMQEFVRENGITMANTANIGRLLPQAFFYTFAFSRLKKKIQGDMYYALTPGNYSNIVAGLYGWQLSLPVNGFIVPATASLTIDPLGKCMVPDSIIPLHERIAADPASPSNIERLENVFEAYSLMLKNFVFPAPVTDAETYAAGQKLFTQYGFLADRATSQAYAAALRNAAIVEEEDGALVLISRDSPALDPMFIMHNFGESVFVPENVATALLPYTSREIPLLNGNDTDAAVRFIVDAVKRLR